MRTWFAFAVSVVAAMAQSAATETRAWQPFGEGTIVRDAGSAGAGHGRTIALEYEIRPGRLSGAILPPPAEIAQMRRMTFWAKSDHATALGVILAEKMPGGGRYTALAWLPAGEWQAIELGPRDFVANDGPKDPVDSDGKLDLDAVQNLAVIDLAQFFGSLPEDGEVPMTVDRAAGKHTLWIGTPELQSAAADDDAPGVIDSFHRRALQWATLGGMSLRRVAQSPLGVPALEASYEPVEGRIQAMLRQLGGVDLARAGRLTFDIASQNETTLVVSLELKKAGAPNGQRFNLTIFPPGKLEVFHVSLKLADFEGPGKLDPAQLKSLWLADISGSADGAVGRNTIWIGNVALVPE